MAGPGFRKSMKPIEVEELLDVVLHRPLGYLVARASYPTRITPDQLTLLSMAIGVMAGLALLGPPIGGTRWLPLAGGLLILSAIIDCSDGQLARMRQSSSRYGRMLDGTVDMIVQFSLVPGALLHLWAIHGGPLPGRPVHGVPVEAIVWVLLAMAAFSSLSVHTALYDHYKNTYLHHILEHHADGDDPEDIEADYQRQRAGHFGVIDWARFGAYRFYLRNQLGVMARVDPYLPRRFRDMAAYSPENAGRYRALNRHLMRTWSFLGIGTHIFLASVMLACNRLDEYILLRLVVGNLVLVGLLPAQRRASREFYGGRQAEPHAAAA